MLLYITLWQADLQQRVTTDVSSMHHLNERVRSLQSQLEQRKLRGAAEEEMTREIEDLRRNLANAKAREDYAKTTIAVEIEAVNQKMAEMQRQLQVRQRVFGDPCSPSHEFWFWSALWIYWLNYRL